MKIYSQEVCSYLNSERFLKNNQRLYLKRFKGISQTLYMENVDLIESYMKLIERKLIKRDFNLMIIWRALNPRDCMVDSKPF